MNGSALASGGKSAQFGPPNVTQEKWDAIWAADKKAKSDIGKNEALAQYKLNDGISES